MKRIFLFLLLFVAVTAKGQTNVYHPFPDSDAVWNVDYEIDNIDFTCGGTPDDFQYSYIINGDTVIGSHNYHKISTPYVNLIDTCGGIHSWGTTGYRGCFRQDVTAKKVFYVSPFDSIEDLLYDFNAQVGDTLRTHFGNCNPPSIVYRIDSILIGSNYRKMWLPQGMSPVIEGIGSSTGLLEESCALITNMLPALMCYTENGNILYSVSPWARCQCWFPLTCGVISAVFDNSVQKNALTLSPNPFHTTATLEIKNEELKIKNWEMKIYNTMGKLVKTITVEKNKQEIIISRGDLSDGLYFYQLITTDGQAATGKFVIE